MADEWKEYVDDPRHVCKYATKCYQKNPEHHRKYKHPPQNIRKEVNRNKRRFSPYTRDSPRHSPNPRRDESPSGKEKAGNESADSREKPANDSSDDDKKTEDSEVSKPDSDDNKKSEDPGVSKPECDRPIDVLLPENITFYDKSTDNSLIKKLFLVEMPEDFFKFFECISECGKSVEDTLASVNLMPIGPYELLLGKLPKLDNKELYLIHWRFFYDPPEFQVIIV